MRGHGSAGEEGFTLIELLMAMMLMGVILTALATGFITAAKGSTGAHDLFVESHDAELLATYFPSDVASADPLLVKWGDTTTPTGCPTTATSSSVLRLQWTEVDAAAATKKAFSASYRSESSDGTTWRLVRYYCFGSGSSSASTDSILTGGGAISSVRTVAHNLGATLPTVAVSGHKISMTLFSHKALSESSAYSWTISASTRSVGNAASVPSLRLEVATSAPVAGAGTNLTITVVDGDGNTNTSYVGAHNLTFGGANSIGGFSPTVSNSTGALLNFGIPTSLSFAGGVANVSGAANGVMKLFKAEGALITVSDGTLSTVTGVPLTVSPGPPTGLSMTAATTTPSAGAPDNLTIAANADQYDNAPTNYSGTKTLVFAGATTFGSNSPSVSDNTGSPIAFGLTTFIDFANGVANVSGSNNGVMRLYKAGLASIKVSDGPINNGAGLAVTVGAGSVAKFTLGATTTSPVAGASDNLTVTATDGSGNTATGYSGDQALTFSGATASANGNSPTVTNKLGVATNFLAPTTITFTAGVSTSGGTMNLYKAESPSIVVTAGTINNNPGLAVTVGAGSAATFVLGAATTSPVAGAGDNLTVTATDPYGNTATGYSGDQALTFSGAAASVNGNSPTVTNKAGVATNFLAPTTITFTAGVSTSGGSMTLYKAESPNIVVSAGTISNGAGLPVVVTAGPPQLSFTGCRLGSSGSFGTCSGNALKLGGTNGVMEGLVSLGTNDLYGNTAPAGSRTVTVGATGDASFVVSYPDGPVTVSPGTQTAQRFRVTHTSNSSGSATLVAHAANGLDSNPITVSKN